MHGLEPQPEGVQVLEGVGFVARNPMLKSGQGFLAAGHQLLELLRVLGSVLAEEGGDRDIISLALDGAKFFGDGSHFG